MKSNFENVVAKPKTIYKVMKLTYFISDLQ